MIPPVDASYPVMLPDRSTCMKWHSSNHIDGEARFVQVNVTTGTKEAVQIAAWAQEAPQVTTSCAAIGALPHAADGEAGGPIVPCATIRGHS